MSQGNPPCVCCSGPALRRVEFVSDFEHFTCGDCGYECFRPIGGEIGSGLYEDDADYLDELELGKDFRHLIQWHHSKTLAYLVNGRSLRGQRSLDVGCFNGFFVCALLDAGFDAFGLDFNQRAVEYGLREYSLRGRLQTCNVEDLAARRERYDVVTCFEVIEHVHDPAALVDNIVSLLNPGGLLVVSTPNSRMCWRPRLDYPPHHLSRFTPRALDLLLRKFGLAVLTHEEQMSLVDLARHFTGAMFRSRNDKSLRGGELPRSTFANSMRRFLNRFRPVLNMAAGPLDRILYWSGLRYIGQLVVAEKMVPVHNRQAPLEVRFTD